MLSLAHGSAAETDRSRAAVESACHRDGFVVRSVNEHVSGSTTSRLSVYLRCLDALAEAGVHTVSSRALAERLHLNAALIRKDLAWFGEFGVRGVGYFVGDLRRNLRRILGLDLGLKLVILGAGNLGCALADYPGFRQGGFDIVAMFDVAPEKVGRLVKGGLLVRHVRELAEVVREARVDIAVVAVPAAAAQEVVRAAVEAGICAVLNFAPGTVRVPDGVALRQVDLGMALETLSFTLAQAARVAGQSD